MEAPVIRRRAVVHGRVQGVFFRDSTARQARTAGVAGWVRNRDDGTVEAVVEGTPWGVDQVLAFLHSGPPRARVARVEVAEETPEGLSGFKVRG